MKREQRRKWIAAKRHNQQFNTYTNKQVEELKAKLLESNMRVDYLQNKLNEVKNALLEERKSAASFRQYKTKTEAYIKTLVIKPIKLKFGTDKNKLTKTQLFTKYRTENIRTFVTLATEHYSLTDDEVLRLYAALNTVSDETLAAFIKKHKLRAAFYESNEELISGEGFTNISYTGMVRELEALA